MKTDSQLQRDVIEELEWDPSIDHADIGVSVTDSVVTLNGYVKTYAEKMAAEKAAKRVAGVKAIAEEIKIRYPSDAKTADHEIAKRILDMFRWNVLIPQEAIQVKVEHGWVTLTGNVAWHYQSQEAKNATARISGVTGVTNLIAIRSAPTTANLHKRIEEAFRRQADLDANTVTIKTEGSKVFLGGRVKAWHERRVAEQAAWSAPGVTQVEDNIMVV
jgi:osmotically-inducible protein OsmY